MTPKPARYRTMRALLTDYHAGKLGRNYPVSLRGSEAIIFGDSGAVVAWMSPNRSFSQALKSLGINREVRADDFK